MDLDLSAYGLYLRDYTLHGGVDILVQIDVRLTSEVVHDDPMFEKLLYDLNFLNTIKQSENAAVLDAWEQLQTVMKLADTEKK